MIIEDTLSLCCGDGKRFRGFGQMNGCDVD